MNVFQELKALQDTVNSINEEKTELKKKHEKAMSMLHSAKGKLQSMKDMNEKLTTERMEMKKQHTEKDQEIQALKGNLKIYNICELFFI